MSDKKEEGEMVESPEIPGARFRDPRPLDVDVFYALLPGVLGGLVAKNADTRSANAMALAAVREMLGQCAMMGILRPVTQLPDGSPLCIVQPGAGPAQAGVAPPTAMYPNQPGMGQPSQPAAQYPTWGQPGGQQPQQPGTGTGMRGALVAMFPNQNNGQPPAL
jgi:hypothetical protein